MQCKHLESKYEIDVLCQQEVMQFSREFKCCTGCCWCGEGCCSMTINVESPVGRLIGQIRTGSV